MHIVEFIVATIIPKQITWIWSNTSTYPSKQELIKISQNSFLTHLGKLNWWGHTVLICKMRENGLSTALGAPESSYYIHNSFERVISLEASQRHTTNNCIQEVGVHTPYPWPQILCHVTFTGISILDFCSFSPHD